MLDLKELERRLDEALSKETSESLSNWLFNQRSDNLENFLGTGCMELFKYSPYTFNQEFSINAKYFCNNEYIPSDNLAMAA